ncbi:protein of unknown function [Methylorubrum extorquens]|uniref:Uncharacterized protein n=1 Tax=Methylorubrum extorquens TaxID=408 RepID=A0A2N9ANK5_METEX|nr:protein of unknown function [Methylorubrum extorquens]
MVNRLSVGPHPTSRLNKCERLQLLAHVSRDKQAITQPPAGPFSKKSVQNCPSLAFIAFLSDHASVIVCLGLGGKNL